MKRRLNFFLITVVVMFFAIAADVFIVYQLESSLVEFLG